MRKIKFNEKLTVLRKEKGMNMTEFANLLGTSKQVIARYERGENTPKITTVAHYAEVLGVSLQYLINEDCTDRTGTTPTNEKRNTPEEPKLSEGEKMWLGLYHRLSDETKKVFVNMMDSFDELPADTQRFLLDAIRIAFGNQK